MYIFLVPNSLLIVTRPLKQTFSSFSSLCLSQDVWTSSWTLCLGIYVWSGYYFRRISRSKRKIFDYQGKSISTLISNSQTDRNVSFSQLGSIYLQRTSFWELYYLIVFFWNYVCECYMVNGQNSFEIIYETSFKWNPKP